MFNFKTLKLDKREGTSNLSSFVGIRRSTNGALEFRLPRGFEEFPDNDFNATKQLFFRMYSTFKKFERDRDSLELDLRALGKDNIERQNNSYRFRDKEDNDVILYSKISLIENLLEAYRDLALNVIERHNDLDEKINFSKIDHYLHKAIYLPNDVIFIEEMDFARQTLQYKSATLIELFCFILFELQNELKQETNTRVQELANRFCEQHLSHEQSLFREETFEITVRTLKDILDDIDKRTTYKDDDYWRLYEAIETFLYGELDMETPHADGTFWGISNFSSVWEDMCTTYAFANFNVVYADSNIIFNGQCVANSRSAGHFPIFKKTNFTDPFYIEFRGKKRWMRPDLVHLISADESENETDWIFSEAIQIVFKRDNGVTADFEVKLIDKSRSSMYQGFCSNLKTAKTQGSRVIGDNSFRSYPKSELEKQKNRIIDIYSRNRIQSKLPSVLFRLLDWKYMDADSFIQGNKKVQTDSTKQLCYQFALQRLMSDSGINSQFVIPWFSGESNDDIGDYMDDAILHQRLRDNKLEVFKANFSKIQAVYLSHD